MVDFTSGARELFENGISFDDSKPASTNLGEVTSPDESPQDWTDRGLSDNPHSGSSLNMVDPTPGRADLTGPQVMNSTPLKYPFLDIRSLGGLSTKKADLSPPLKPLQAEMQREEAASRGKHVFDFLLKRRRHRAATEDPQEYSKNNPATIVDDINQEVKMSARVPSSSSKAPPSIDGNQLLKDMLETEPLCANQRSINKTSHLRDACKKVQVTAHHVPTEAGTNNVLKPTSHHKTEAAKEDFLRERIHREVRLLKQSMLKSDEPAQKSPAKARAVLVRDSAWIEDVMKDITKKGDEVKEQSASIPTITTTGCDLPTPASSQNQEENSEKKAVHGAEKTLSPEYSTSLMASPSWPASQRSRTSKILQSLEMEMTPTVATFTSAKHPMPLDRAPRRMLSERANIRQPRRQTKGGFSKSPMSMCTLLRTPAETPSSNQNLPEKTTECSVAQREEQGCALAESSTLTLGPLKGVPPESMSLTIMTREPRFNQARRVKVKPGMEETLFNLMERCPGTYPYHLDDEEDTVVHFMDLGPRDTEPTSPKSPAECGGRLCDVLIEFRDVVKSFIRLYISLVGPFFDSSSDYWSRNDRGESTWADCGVVMLAIPPGILATIALV